MKNLFVSLAVAAVLFAIGCQENSITDPIASEPVSKVQTGVPDTYHHGIIPLEGTLNDPYPIGNSFYRISGQIEYDLKVFFMDPMPPVAQQYFSVYFQTNAELVYVCSLYPYSEEDELAGFIAEVWEDYRPLGVKNILTIEKTFSIQGREDGMVLKTRFLVTKDKIELSSMWLALPPQASEIINNY
jgi:hypothetical protein